MLWRRESPWHLQPNRNRPGVRVRVGESEHECDEHRLGAYAVARLSLPPDRCFGAHCFSEALFRERDQVGGVSKTWNETERLAAEGWTQGRAQEGARAEESDPARGGGSTEVELGQERLGARRWIGSSAG